VPRPNGIDVAVNVVRWDSPSAATALARCDEGRLEREVDGAPDLSGQSVPVIASCRGSLAATILFAVFLVALIVVGLSQRDRIRRVSDVTG